jgi:hypothetical protein
VNSGSPPAPPNPQVVSNAQTGSNINSAIANTYLGNPNVTTPNGSWTTKPTGSTMVGKNKVPTFTQTLKLTPAQQRLNNINNNNAVRMSNIAGQQIGRVGQHLRSPINTDGLPEIDSSIGGSDFSTDRQRVEDALMSRLNPQLAQDSEALRTRMANQGIMPGTEAYSREMVDMNNASTDARMQAILAGGQEQNRMFDLEKQKASFGNAARQQSWAERLQLRNQPINEITALMSGGQLSAPGQPNFAAGTVAPTNTAGNTYDAYNARLQNYQMQQNQQNAMMGGLFGLGGAAIDSGLFGF